MWKAVIIVALMWLLVTAITIAIDYYRFFNKHRCPHCGHKMKYLCTRYDEEDSPIEYSFHCPECGKVVTISHEDLLNEIELFL